MESHPEYHVSFVFLPNMAWFFSLCPAMTGIPGAVQVGDEVIRTGPMMVACQ